MMPFEPTPQNSTIDSRRWHKNAIAWDDLDWSAREWRERSIWTALGLGDDPHWCVPHKDKDTHHRIRKARVRKAETRPG